MKKDKARSYITAMKHWPMIQVDFDRFKFLEMRGYLLFDQFNFEMKSGIFDGKRSSIYLIVKDQLKLKLQVKCQRLKLWGWFASLNGEMRLILNDLQILRNLIFIMHYRLVIVAYNLVRLKNSAKNLICFIR